MPRNFVSIKTVERGTVPRRLQTVLNRATRTGLRAAAETHHKENVPKRFTAEHAREARYIRRSRVYQERKQREGRGNDPLVYSARTRARAKVARITATGQRVTLSYSLPTLNFTVGPRSQKRTMRSEFEKVLYTERQRGERLATKTINGELKKDKAVSRRKLV